MEAIAALSRRRSAAYGAIALLLLAPFRTGAAEGNEAERSPTESQETPQPKFIWGLLLNVVLKYAMSLFADWLLSKLTVDLSPPAVFQRLVANSKQANIVSLSSVSSFGAKSAGAPENTVLGEPTTPFKLEQDHENYQAVHVAIVAFDRSGKVTGLRPVSAGFSTGDRIKLKVLPTFDGILVIESINPSGVRRQIFPPDPATVILVKRGLEVLIPMAEDYYFEFTGQTGDDQLVISIRDPRAFGEAASVAPANRKDDKYGSSFLQETAPETYPLISQSLKFSHRSR